MVGKILAEYDSQHHYEGRGVLEVAKLLLSVVLIADPVVDDGGTPVDDSDVKDNDWKEVEHDQSLPGGLNGTVQWFDFVNQLTFGERGLGLEQLFCRFGGEFEFLLHFVEFGYG